MAVDRQRYPREWPAIRERILKRADNRCEECGARAGEPHPITGTLVRLQIAHYPDWRPENVSPENLHAYCPRCHTAKDREMHQRVRRQKQERGQLVLFEVLRGKKR